MILRSSLTFLSLHSLIVRRGASRLVEKIKQEGVRESAWHIVGTRKMIVMISCFKKCLIWCAINWHMEDARKGLQFQIWDLHPALNGWFWAGGRGSDANMIIWVQRLTPSCQVTQLENCFRTSNSFPLLLRDWVRVREENKKKKMNFRFWKWFYGFLFTKS